MKSQKAKELIEKYAVDNSRDAAPSMMKGRAVECVEIAEQEAEERMREKAIEAFCDECACFEACICCLPAGACDRKNNFIQKLTKK